MGGLPDPKAGTQGTQGSRGTAGSAGIGGHGEGVKGTEQSGHGPDRVSLSNLAATLRPEETDRGAELDRLSELYNRGVYEPDPERVAENLIDEGLMQSPEEQDGGSQERG